MAVREYHFYHGAALSQIVSEGEFTGLARLSECGSGAYAINHDKGVYIKHSTKSDGPWQFTFSQDHQKGIRNMFRKYGDKTYIVLVCGEEGICLLDYGEYAGAIDENFKEQEYLSVDRPEGGGFRVRGAGGKINRVIPLSRFPAGIFAD